MLSKNRNKGNAELAAGIGCVGSVAAVGLFGFVAWVNHLFWVFETLMSDQGVTFGQFFLIIVGTLVAPIGAAHGVYLWFV